jgi:hypothetical protein
VKSAYNAKEALELLARGKNFLAEKLASGLVFDDRQSDGKWLIPAHRLARYCEGFWADQWVKPDAFGAGAGALKPSPLICGKTLLEASLILIRPVDVVRRLVESGALPADLVLGDLYFQPEVLRAFMIANGYVEVIIDYGSVDPMELGQWELPPRDSITDLTWEDERVSFDHPDFSNPIDDDSDGYDSVHGSYCYWYKQVLMVPPDHIFHPSKFPHRTLRGRRLDGLDLLNLYKEP